MKLKLLFLFLFLVNILSAQTFTEAPLSSDFEDIYSGSIAFADVNGDNNFDVLITGQNNSFGLISKLYINDGQGNFSVMPGTPFVGVGFGSIAFSDVDGDNDPDVLITGVALSRIAKLYINDGQGNFSELPDTPFDGVRESSIAFADVDGNNSPDVLITGRNSSDIRISKLYTNDGQGNFSEKTDTPFQGVDLSSVAFADVDGDNDSDVLITGLPDESGNEGISKLYANDGQGNFSEVTGTPFAGVSQGSIAFSDIDGDNDSDVLITGIGALGIVAKLYINDGMGNFSEMPEMPFDGVVFSSVSFADVNQDNYPDVFITGATNPSDQTSKLYINNGQGSFSEVLNTPFEGVFFSSIASADVDGDTDLDILITGRNSSFDGISKLYLNDLMVPSTNLEISGFNSKIITYPNPAASNDLKVDFNSTENGFANISVYNLNGQLLNVQKAFTVMGPQTISVDISSLSSGSYFIQIDNEKRTRVASFIVP